NRSHIPLEDIRHPPRRYPPRGEGAVCWRCRRTWSCSRLGSANQRPTQSHKATKKGEFFPVKKTRQRPKALKLFFPFRFLSSSLPLRGFVASCWTWVFASRHVYLTQDLSHNLVRLQVLRFGLVGQDQAVAHHVRRQGLYVLGGGVSPAL